ncbi:MAG: hypothetical protein WCF28_10215 [Methanobacterium sp.]|uniref:hypothetical protein n=1 Tax=Methanobacterium sp. TaxID=2164 RepID=UPI003C794B61
MKETIEINKTEDRHTRKPKKRNIWGIYISLCFIFIGIIWYGVNIGMIPLTFIKEQAGPIIVVVIGFLILLKSLMR